MKLDKNIKDFLESMFKRGNNLEYSLGFTTYNDLYEKMLFDAELVLESIQKQDEKLIYYTFFNFVTTAYHLSEWIEKLSEKDKIIHKVETEIRSNKFFKLCRDFCNCTKHSEFDKPSSTQDLAVSLSFFEDTLTEEIFFKYNLRFVYKDETTDVYLEDFVAEVKKLYEVFFENNL